MFTAILSRTWWSSRKRGEGESQSEEPTETRSEGETQAAEGNGEPREPQPRNRRFDDAPRRDSRSSDSRASDTRSADIGEGSDDDEEVETHLPEDPLAAAFELGNSEEEEIRPKRREKPVAKARIDSAKEFFTTELLYRFDILERDDREKLAGSYRIEVKGNKGGIWTLNLGQELEVINRREEADTILALQHRDFVAIVNGDINPQLALLAQKVRFTGDVKRVVNFQNLLSPLSD